MNSTVADILKKIALEKGIPVVDIPCGVKAKLEDLQGVPKLINNTGS